MAFVSPARAAYTNSNTILLGERAAGLGGAFTALAGDPSATPYYNPATSILQEGSSFSGAVSIYNKYETNIGQPGDFVNSPSRINRGFFRAVPASSGTILNYKDFAIGLSILKPDYDFYSGQVQGGTDTVTILNFVDESLWVGGTFSKKLSDLDSVGVSLYYTARTFQRSTNDRITTGGGTGATLTIEDKNLTTNNLVAIFGYHRQIGAKWAVGISYRAPSLQIAGEGTYYRSTTITSPYSDTVTNQGSIRAVTNIPQRLAIGIAREVPFDHSIAVDVQMYAPLNYRDFPDFAAGSDDLHYHFTTNIAAGYEHYLRHWLSLRGGVFTNLTSTDDVDATSSFRQPDHINMYGWSANVNIRTHEQTSFTFGGYYTGGTGITNQLVGGQTRVTPKSQQIFTMLIGTGFHF